MAKMAPATALFSSAAGGSKPPSSSATPSSSAQNRHTSRGPLGPGWHAQEAEARKARRQGRPRGATILAPHQVPLVATVLLLARASLQALDRPLALPGLPTTTHDLGPSTYDLDHAPRCTILASRTRPVAPCAPGSRARAVGRATGRPLCSSSRPARLGPVGSCRQFPDYDVATASVTRVVLRLRHNQSHDLRCQYPCTLSFSTYFSFEHCCR